MILKYSIEQVNNGFLFPIWSTCNGHGMLGYLTFNYNPNTWQLIENAPDIMNILKIINR
jgi:hypothetical protein